MKCHENVNIALMKLHKSIWSKTMKILETDEKKLLFHIYITKFGDNYKPFTINDLVYDFIKEYNQDDIIKNIASLASQEFVVVKRNGTTLNNEIVQRIFKDDPIITEMSGLELCAPNVEKMNEIKKGFRYRRGINWLKINCILTWQFIWKHFIVTIIVAALTAFIITKYIPPP